MVSYNVHSLIQQSDNNIVCGFDNLKEASKNGHGFMVDFYSLGVLLYEMIVGIPPHIDSNRMSMF